MKVYIVTSGEYSCYQIEAVFTNEEQAELYCATHIDCEIEEWEADEIKLAPQEIWILYTVMFTRKLRTRRISHCFSISRKGKK